MARSAFKRYPYSGSTRPFTIGDSPEAPSVMARFAFGLSESKLAFLIQDQLVSPCSVNQCVYLFRIILSFFFFPALLGGSFNPRRSMMAITRLLNTVHRPMHRDSYSPGGVAQTLRLRTLVWFERKDFLSRSRSKP